MSARASQVSGAVRLAPMLRFNQLEQIEFPIAEEVVAEMALDQNI